LISKNVKAWCETSAAATGRLEPMADQTYELDEHGAPMDYPQHESTYSLFLLITKWGIIANCALLVAMAVGFFLGGGLVGGTLTFIVLMIAARILA